MSGLYIHIPFCAQKCIYCDFYSIVSNRSIYEYLKCVLNELNLRLNELESHSVDTLYIGGGTPSLIPGKILIKFINQINEILGDNSNIVEFTIEVNPDDITEEYCSAIKESGINRVSMGVQSFVDTELSTIKRRHDSQQAIKSYKLLRDSGINNISIDLIYGLPGQTLESWGYSLNTAMKLKPNHISVYSLMYEEGTLLYRLRTEGKIKECSDELYISMDSLLQETLKDNGYIRYEISNYSLPGFESKHNSNYWNSSPYLGLGAGAHSYDGSIRRYNPNNVRKYIESLSSNEKFYKEEKESLSEIFNDFVMTHLRTTRGINLHELEKRFPAKFVDDFLSTTNKYVKIGKMAIQNGYAYINNDSFMISDRIISDLFVD